MNAKDLLDIYYKKNPNWKKDGANLTASGLAKLIETTFSQGFQAGSKDNTNENPVSDIFGDIFKR